jgi:hypothetical protein
MISIYILSAVVLACYILLWININRDRITNSYPYETLERLINQIKDFISRVKYERNMRYIHRTYRYHQPETFHPECDCHTKGEVLRTINK